MISPYTLEFASSAPPPCTKTATIQGAKRTRTRDTRTHTHTRERALAHCTVHELYFSTSNTVAGVVVWNMVAALTVPKAFLFGVCAGWMDVGEREEGNISDQLQKRSSHTQKPLCCAEVDVNAAFRMDRSTF